MNTGEIILYTTSDGATALDVRLEQDNIWINRQQMAELFDRDIKTIGKHINNALKEELKDISVVAKFATTASDGKTYQVEHYNIEMITSVGYRVKSQRGTQFRIWANKVLKEYLIKGYAVKDNIKLEQYEDLKQTIKVLAKVLDNKTLEYSETTGLLRVVTDYAYALDTLDRYDYQQLEIDKTTNKPLTRMRCRLLMNFGINLGEARFSETKRMNRLKAPLVQYIRLLASRISTQV